MTQKTASQDTSTATALAAVQLDSAGKAPAEIELMPAGTVQPRPHDGRQAWINDAPDAVVAATAELKGDLPIDYEHQGEHARTNGQPAPAAGWVKEVFARDGAVWGRVEWTDRARAFLENREYRFISPSFLFDKATRQVTRIIGAALTNDPALYMRAIASANPGESDHMDIKALAAALGLPEDASEEQILAAAKASREALANTRKAAGLDDKADAAAIADKVTELATAASRAGKEATVDPTRYVPIEQHQLAMARIEKVEKNQTEERAVAAVDKAVKEGKLVPAAREWGLSLARKDLPAFEAYVGVAPTILSDGKVVQGDPDKAKGGLSEDERALCRSLGLTEEAFKTIRDADMEASR